MSDNYVHFHSSPPINRLSYLRTSASFLTLALTHPRALFLPFHSGRPLLLPSTTSPAYLPFSAVSVLLGPAPYFQQGPTPGAPQAEEAKWTESARFRSHGVPLVFLGLLEDENTVILPSKDLELISKHEDIHGAPYWAMDTSDLGERWMDEIEGMKGAEWREPRGATAGYSHFDAGTFSVARSMIDWNGRNRFCPGCGSPTHSMWAGWKLGCTTLLPWSTNKTPFNGQPCPSSKGLHNFAHPRTDAVIIVAVVRDSPTTPGEEDLLLGRQRAWPKGMYSTLAGFLEPGESLEDAVRREILEESGVAVSRVRYHSSQPWPYPANLMFGCYAHCANPHTVIRTDLDNELEDARWFTRAEIRAVLGDPDGTVIRRAEHGQFDADEQEKARREAEEKRKREGVEAAAALAPSEGKVSEGIVTKEGAKVRVPPRTAIAGVLISEWANGRLKGNL